MLPTPWEGWGSAVAVGCSNGLLVKKCLAATETEGSLHGLWPDVGEWVEFGVDQTRRRAQSLTDAAFPSPRAPFLATLFPCLWLLVTVVPCKRYM
jgi:hypothetical protein